MPPWGIHHRRCFGVPGPDRLPWGYIMDTAGRPGGLLVVPSNGTIHIVRPGVQISRGSDF